MAIKKIQIKPPDNNYGDVLHPETDSTQVLMGDNNTLEQFKTDTNTALAGKSDSNHSHNDYVPTTRTINGKALSGNITLTAADVEAADLNPTVTALTDNTTLALTNAGKVLDCTNASAITVTIPANTSVAFPVDTEIAILRSGAGDVTLAAASGVTLNSDGGKKKIKAQHTAAALKKIDTDTWILIGNLS